MEDAFGSLHALFVVDRNLTDEEKDWNAYIQNSESVFISNF